MTFRLCQLTNFSTRKFQTSNADGFLTLSADGMRQQHGLNKYPPRMSATVIQPMRREVSLPSHIGKTRGKRWATGPQFSSQKGVDFRREWSVTVPCRDKGRLAPSGILPRWRCCHCGASVVTAPGTVATEKDPQMHSKTPRKTKFARAKSRANRSAKPGTIPLASTLGGTKQEAVLALLTQCNDYRHHEGDGLAAALGPRLLCGYGAQEARLNVDIGEGRRRTRLSCD
jgi:hypothetical protein